MDGGIKERLERVEDDVKNLKKIYKDITDIKIDLKEISTKLNNGHPCKHDLDVQNLLNFKENAEKTIESSISKNQAAIYIIFSAILSALVGYTVGILK